MVSVLENMLHYESKMHEKRFRWFLNIFLAAVIYYNAEIGRWAGLQQLPLAISVVWPATGFSLAALLVFGYRAWPGIFLGNFCYNFLHFYLSSQTIIGPLFWGTCVTLGSLMEAIFAAYIMRRFSSSSYFGTVKDVFIFLIPAAFLGSLIASTVGATALYFTGTIPDANVITVWLTFLIGDCMGVYIFTPLLVVWSISKPMVHIKHHVWELFLMCLAFALIAFLNVVWDYPIPHFFIPLCGWVAYRFRMHGATLAIFLVALATIIPTVLGVGSFATKLVADQLLILVTFIEVIVAISLVVAAISNEKDAAWNLLENQNIDLQDAVEMHLEEIKEMSDDVSVKEKLVALGMLTSNMAKHIPCNHKKISEFAKRSLEAIGQLRIELNSKKDQITPELVQEIQNNFETIQDDLEGVVRCTEHASRIAKIIQEQSDITTPGRTKAKSIHMNTLVNICLIQAMADEAKHHPNFTFSVSKEFDKTIKMIFALPEDLAHAFIYIFKNAFYSMKQKRDLLVARYIPMLEVHTINHDDNVELVIRDNGVGVSDEQKKSFFRSFMTKEPSDQVSYFSDDVSDLGLTLAHDILVHVHHGKIQVSSTVGEYLQINVLLPKREK